MQISVAFFDESPREAQFGHVANGGGYRCTLWDHITKALEARYEAVARHAESVGCKLEFRPLGLRSKSLPAADPIVVIPWLDPEVVLAQPPGASASANHSPITPAALMPTEVRILRILERARPQLLNQAAIGARGAKLSPRTLSDIFHP